MNYVSTFEDACARLGRKAELPDVSQFPEKIQKHLIAGIKLDAILEVNNEGWVPDMGNTSQWKYYPWFNIVADKAAAGGFRLSAYGFVYDFSHSYLGARHACRSGELARWMGKNCAELYDDMLR